MRRLVLEKISDLGAEGVKLIGICLRRMDLASVRIEGCLDIRSEVMTFLERFIAQDPSLARPDVTPLSGKLVEVELVGLSEADTTRLWASVLKTIRFLSVGLTKSHSSDRLTSTMTIKLESGKVKT